MGESSRDSLPLSLERRIDALCQRFERAWKAAAAGGGRVELAAYLAEVPEQARQALLLELLRVEAHYRRRAGEEPTPADYQNLLPTLPAELLAEALSAPSVPPAGMSASSGR